MKATGDFIILKVDESPIRTESGIEIPRGNELDGPIAQIHDVGPDVKQGLKAGDWVLTDTRYVTNVIIKGKLWRYCRETGVVGTLTNEEATALPVSIPDQVDIVSPTGELVT